MKRRRETPIAMSVVEFVVKKKPVMLSMIPIPGNLWSCSADATRFFNSREKSYGLFNMKGMLTAFKHCNGRIPTNGFEFAMAIAIYSLNDLIDKDGNLPEEIEVRDLSILEDVCEGYLDLMKTHESEIAQLKTQLEEARRKSR